MARLHIITGKEYCGKSTVASLAALRSVMHRNRTLLISLDPERSLDLIFQMKIGNKKRSLSSLLTVTEAVLDKSRSHLQAVAIRKRFHLSPFGKKEDISNYLELLGLSDAVEMLNMLSVLQDAMRIEKYDDIFIDTPSLLCCMKTLALPIIINKRIREALQGNLDEKTVFNLKALLNRYERLQKQIADPDYVEIMMIMDGQLQEFGDEKFMKNILSNAGLKINHVLVNRTNPDDKFVHRIAEEFNESIIETLADYGRPIRGIDFLSKFSQQIYNYIRPSHVAVR